MLITILAVGIKMPNWVDEAFKDYSKRFGKEAKIALKEIKPEKRGAGVSAEQGIALEEARLRAAIPPNNLMVVLDERGQSLRSTQLAKLIEKWQFEGHNICFIIGGADGLSQEFKSKADLLIKLSDLTLPHGMVRVLLIEQLYRALSILQNHPYHRE
ncbi:23S rRNA (pseudouridine(1915)-N(3))-methyltransferase RlmH [Neisseria sp. Ec49-e6-T10]|uniref:23S rRNA (pseudouridine(1915)-N(3))-methyltransferase RlmH n=1 Tax=Neisseria sp. Ec49-e6-T10 TaxID=3140744 RepID=UPI003EB70B35